MMRMKPLTEKRLMAIREALNSRLAGAMDDTDLDRDHYLAALEWAREKLREKQRRREYATEAKHHPPPPSITKGLGS